MTRYPSNAWRDRVRTLLDYDADTGILTWRVSPKHGMPAGTIAGVIDSKGYRVITINRRMYKAHRLAWLYVNGEWPNGDLDHINGSRSDNRISNLREASRSQNVANSTRSRRNTSGFKGVHWDKKTGAWMARIAHQGQRTYLGLFSNPEDAHAAYRAAAKQFHGEYARSS